jgi:cytochrome d ubiquinol oxidase subunit II
MTLEALWFTLAALTFVAYVVLDGFDFGAGGLHLLVARADAERRQVLAAIGPFWDGNEVWLLAGGGLLFLAFPKVLASGLSGFYLAIFMVLWALILRGIAIEFRSHLGDAMWRGFWDVTFCLVSLLLPVLLGAAFGNLLRGVPVDAQGWFALPLFDSFSPWGAPGVLDWYTVLCGLTALLALLHHGALFLIWRTSGAVAARSNAWAARLWPGLLAAWLLATWATGQVAPDVLEALVRRPLVLGAALVALAGLVASLAARRAGRERLAFLSSGAFLAGLLLASAAARYPVWLRSSLDPTFSLTALNAAAPPASLRAGLWWWPVGALLALFYLGLLLHLHRGKVAPESVGDGY